MAARVSRPMDSDEIAFYVERIYDRFQVIGNLRLHMRRVAAVGELIVDSWLLEPWPDREDIVAALLLHDLGNIVKFNFENTSLWDGYGRDEVAGWRDIRDSIVRRYSSSTDHDVTVAMLKELGANGRVRFLVSNMLLENIESVLQSGDMELKVCTYADQRVSPRGVTSIAERFRDLRSRYGHRGATSFRESREDLALDLEAQIFQRTAIEPSSIDEEAVSRYVKRYGN